MQAIRYHVNPARPRAHIFQVECSVPDPDPRGQRFTLPAWIPGSYLVRDFAGNIVTLRANSRGREVGVSKLDKQTWLCEPLEGELTLRYEVYAWDASVRTAYLDTTRGFFNGTSVFLSPLGFETRPCEVVLSAPKDPACSGWRAATAMPSVDIDAAGFGAFRIENYAELIDHPVEMGAFSRIGFTAGGVPHELILAGVHNAGSKRLAGDLETLCNTHIALFGDARPPMAHYLFLTRVVGSGYGGLEHRASSSLVCSRHALPTAGQEEGDEDYRIFLGLCSHEYFHVWNVKRIRPEAFYNAELGSEAYTEDLWAYEGVTAYYDQLMLVRAGLVSPQQYLTHLSRSATRLWRTPARHKQTLAQSSFDAWIKFYKQGDDAPNSVVSYYNKGALVALCLDLKLRLETDGNVSLDDVMRGLWNEYGSHEQPVPEHGIEQMAEQVSGLSLMDFFDVLIRGVADPPLAKLLPAFGVDCSLQSAHEADGTKPSVYLGVSLRGDQASPTIAHVLEDSPAQAAGLSPGDELVAMSGLRVGGDNLDKHLNAAQAGQPMSIDAFRRDELMRFAVIPGVPPKDTWIIKPAENPATPVKQRWDGWLWRPAQQKDSAGR